MCGAHLGPSATRTASNYGLTSKRP